MKELLHFHFFPLIKLGGTLFKKNRLALIGLLLLSMSTRAQVDLYIKNPNASPAIVASGAEVSITSTLSNGGSGYVNYTYTGYYLSTDTIFTKEDTYLNSVSSYLYGNDNSNLYLDLSIPSATKPAKYYIILVADHYGYVAETNELNNTAYVGITVSQPLIDLAITDLKLSSSILSAGSNFTVSNYLQNKGETSSGYSYTGYYLSSDTTLDINTDQVLNNYSDSYSVKGNSKVEQSASLYIPANVKVGNMYVIASADYQFLVSETNEKNNISYVPITISKPDLVSKNPALSATTVSAGGTIKASVFVLNQGATTTGSSSTGYYLSTDTIFNRSSDTYLSYSYLGSLAAGETSAQSSSLNIPTTVSPGSYYVLFVADYGYSVDEKDEKNNVSRVPLSITNPDIDLQIVNPYSSQTEVSPGNYFEVSHYLKNIGKSNAGSSYTGYYLSKNAAFDMDEDILLGSSEAYSVSSSSSISQYRELSLPSTVEDGNYFLFFVADYLDFVSEVNEGNNVASIAITVGKPDLLVTNVTLSSSSVEAGSQIKVYSFLKNTGSASSRTSYLGYYLSSDTVFDINDRYLSYSYSSQIKNGEYDLLEKTLDIPANVEPGAFYLVLYADYENSNVEINEKNNYAAVKIGVVPPNIDLVISKVYTSANKISQNEYLTVSNTLTNLGKSRAGENYTGYYLSKDTVFDSSADTYLASSSVYSLSGNSATDQSQSFSLSGNLAIGTYYVLVVADYNKMVSEQNEKNNVVAVPVEVTAPNVDLIVTNAAVAKNFTPGSYVNVSNTLNNIGTSIAGYSYTGYYLSKDTIFNNNSDTFLGRAYGYSIYGGSSTYQNESVFVPSNVSTGTYYMLFVANYDDAVSEINAKNNVKYLPVNVTAPFIDLTIPVISLSDTLKSPGSSIRIYNTLYNVGTSYSTYSYTAYYLSKDSIFDKSDVFISNQGAYGLSAGETSYQESYVTIPSETVAGNYYILAVADYTNVILEENEKNNVRAAAFRLTEPFTDVAIDFSFLSKAYLAPGQSVELYNNVINKGTTDIDAVNTIYYLSKDSIFDAADTYLSEAKVGYLRSGAEEYQYNVLNIASSTATGSYYILFVLDPKNIISERNEANNIRYEKLVVTKDISKGDLTIADATFDSYSMKPGFSYEVGSYLANIGTKDIGASNIGYFLSTDSKYDSLDVLVGSALSSEAIAGKGHYNNSVIQILKSTELGRYYLLSVADYKNEVDEINELNNVFSAKVIIDIVSGLISSAESMDITVYPNPATDHVKVNLPISVDTEVEYSLVTVLGLTVKSGTIDSFQLAEKSISLTGLTKGLYTLVLNDGKKKYYKAFTIE
ncbi:MAG TPA: CARDB domain-containing protein [Cytophagaceae bacterium]|jgi:subtilase family serine protease